MLRQALGAEKAAGEAAAVVLAGGRSSRMGRPKALLPFDGEPIIVHTTRRLGAMFGEVAVVAAADQHLPPLAARVVRDRVAFQGPLGGLCYGLRAVRAEVAFVASCDAPFLNLSLIEYLLAQIPGHDVVAPHWQGRLQPLHAVYRRRILPLLERQLARGELRPVAVYEQVGTRVVSEEEVRGLDPQGWSFLNLNTPADYEAALARWRGLHGRVACRVELFGQARLLAGTNEVEIGVPAGCALSGVLLALAERVPALTGAVIQADGRGLAAGYTCNLNGLEFVRQPETTPIGDGDRILIFSSDAGG